MKHSLFILTYYGFHYIDDNVVNIEEASIFTVLTKVQSIHNHTQSLQNVEVLLVPLF